MALIDFAILAPIPLEHLPPAAEIARNTGYVSFGSYKFELFRQIDHMAQGEQVPVVIYPSHESDVVHTSFRISWCAWYIGHVAGHDEKRSDERSGHRPATTQQYENDNAIGWPIFWRIKDLQQLPSEHHKRISDLASYKTGFWRKNSPPRGPEVVARPEWI
jgi:hypothetical protein